MGSNLANVAGVTKFSIIGCYSWACGNWHCHPGQLVMSEAGLVAPSVTIVQVSVAKEVPIAGTHMMDCCVPVEGLTSSVSPTRNHK